MALTKGDFTKLEELMDRKIEERFDLEPNQNFDEKLKYLPTKEEFYTQTDRLMKELKDMREEITIISGIKHQVNDHEERIEKIEDNLQI